MSANEGHRDRDGFDAPVPPQQPKEYRPPQPPSPDLPAEGSAAEPQSPRGVGSVSGGAARSSPSAAARPAEEEREYASAPEITLKVPDFLKSMKPSHWLTLLLSQAAAYVTLVVFALLTLIGLIVGLLLSGSEDLNAQVPDVTGGMDFAPSMIILFITLPFQLAAMWLLGTFGLNISLQDSMSQLLPTGGGMGGNLWAPNLLYLALALLMAIWFGRRLLRRSPQAPITEAPRLARLTANVVLALLMAGLTLLVTWIFSFRQGFSLADLAALEGASDAEAQQLGGLVGIDASETVLSMSGNAAGGTLFLTAFVFYLLIGLMLSVGSGAFTRVRKNIEYILPSASGIPRVFATHALIIGVPVVIYLAVDFTFDAGPVAAFSILLWGFSAALFSFILLNFGAISISGGMAGLGQTQAGAETLYLWTGDFAWWAILLAIVLGLAAIAVTSLVWALRRDSQASTLRNLLSWVTLPLSYAVLGAVLTMIGQLRGAGDLMGLADMSFHIGPVWWSFAVLLLVGIVIEALSRFAAPLAQQKLPLWVRRLLGGSKAEK